MDEFELIVRQAVELAVVGPIAYDLQFLAMMVRCAMCPSVPVWSPLPLTPSPPAPYCAHTLRLCEGKTCT